MKQLHLKRGKDYASFVELCFKSGSWGKDGAPENGCRVRTAALEKSISSGGKLGVDDLIHGLMDWLDVTDDPGPTILTLRMMLDRHFPRDDETEVACRFNDEGMYRTLKIGPVDRSKDLVSWQRDGWIIALAQASREEVGRMVVAASFPLTLDVAQKLLALGMESFMAEPFDSYEGAKAMSGKTSNFYAWEAGEVATCHLPHGLGRREQGGEIVDCSQELFPLPESEWLAPNQVAAMLAIAGGYGHS